ncbi:drebrin-like protein B isoform X2 [Saccostrea echinata]|uniref:drebrin-like protein B isoform X2 n=1 Tax=Saccostrea echinata TaxID=191078 RepID=UPI002A7EACE7|nr:drebrin-like protein B isoform X2 [Saccostrea echinata]
MAIDIRKNKDALLKAYNDVVDEKTPTDWMVMGYEGQTAILKLVGTGGGGIEEMTEDLNSSKIMYAYCKVLDPNTNLPKYVLINWQGEAAPESMKFKCTSHLRDVAAFVRGVHVTVNARTEEDVDPDDIVKKVAKASGANYSIHQEKPKAPPQKPTKNIKKEDSPGPVGSVYQRTIAAKDINSKARDKFWAETEKEEQRRIEEEKQRRVKEQQELEKERKEREAREAQERDKIVNEKMKAAREQKVRERRASEIEREEQKKRWEQQQQEAFKEEEERGRRSEAIRKERAAEAARLTSSSTANARALFKRRESETEDNQVSRAPPPPRKIQHGFLNNQQQEEEPVQRKQPIQLPQNPPKPERSFAEPEPSGPSFSSPPREPSPPPREPSPPPREPSPPPRTPSPQLPKVQRSEPEPQLPRARNLLAQGLPPRQDSDEENNNEDEWGEGTYSNYNAEEPHIPAVVSHPPPDEDQYPPEMSPTQNGHDQYYDDQEQQQQYQGEQNTSGILPEHGLCARALYDYQAADESEITFDPDQIITNIEQIDEGWWTGMGPDGSHGMFPANYVELING